MSSTSRKLNDQTRTEYDSFGAIENRYYGAETARALTNYKIGLPDDKIPLSIIKAFALLKKAYAIVNKNYGLKRKISDAITAACDDIISDKLNNEFPLSIWQTISGKQINMNINEVVSNRAIEILGAIHIATALQLNHKLFPALEHVQGVLKKKAQDFALISTCNATTLPDSFLITLSQEFSEYINQISINIENLQRCETRLYQLTIDDKVIQTETNNTSECFGECVANCLSNFTGFLFINASNKFEDLNTYHTMVELSGTLNTLAVNFLKIVNDIRLLSSKSRCDIGELIFSGNKSNNSTMHNQINLIEYEAMTMVAAQVMNNHLALINAISTEHLQFTVVKPLIIKNILYSINLLGDICYSFTNHLILGIQLIKHPSISSSSATTTNEKLIDISTNSTKPVRHHSQGIKRRSMSASPPSVTINTKSTTSKISNNDYINDESNSSILNMESPLIGMNRIINNLKSPTSSHKSSKNSRSKHQSMNNLNLEHMSKSMDHMNMITQHTPFQNKNLHHNTSGPSSSSKSSPHSLSLFDPMQQHIYRLPQSNNNDIRVYNMDTTVSLLPLPPPPRNQQPRPINYLPMMNNNFVMGPIHHPPPLPPPMCASHHSIQSNDIRPPPQQQQQEQQQTNKALIIRNLAEELKNSIQ